MSELLLEEADRAEDAPHPRVARRLVGHAGPEQAILEAWRAGRLPHAIILGGPAGIGKATFAWRLAKFLLDDPKPRAVTNFDVPEGSRSAGLAMSLAHPDLVLLRREYNEKTKRFFTEIRIDDVRRTIDLFHRAASAGGYRICIVDSAEDLNRSSANALLKMIEEPPPRSLFLMVAHRPGLILPTIRSRSRLIRFEPLRESEIIEVVAGLGPPWSDLAAHEVASAAARAQGSVGEALRLLGHRGAELRMKVAELLAGLPQIDWRDVHRLAETVAGREGGPAFDLTMSAIFDWLDETVRARASAGDPRRLAPLAEVWEKVADAARETEALNLDKRPLIMSIFSDLAAAARAASA